MQILQAARKSLGVSQRALAARAGIAYKSLQLIEGSTHNASLRTLAKLAEALDLSGTAFGRYVAEYFSHPADSVYIASHKLVGRRATNWKVVLFDWVDAFRCDHDPQRIAEPPINRLDARLRALIAAMVETLCDEAGMAHPPWCAGVPALVRPWFVAGLENVKAMALVESPIHFRKRNVFVLASILERV